MVIVTFEIKSHCKAAVPFKIRATFCSGIQQRDGIINITMKTALSKISKDNPADLDATCKS